MRLGCTFGSAVSGFLLADSLRNTIQFPRSSLSATIRGRGEAARISIHNIYSPELKGATYKLYDRARNNESQMASLVIEIHINELDVWSSQEFPL